MNYKTYAEAKIANPDSEIVTTGKKWNGCGSFAGVFQKINDGGKCDIGDDSWVICNPADYCSSIKEFLEAGYIFSVGDFFIGIDGEVISVRGANSSSVPYDDDYKRYILSAATLNGGCKIPAKAEQWSVYNNTTPLCELTDEQAAMLFNAWRGGSNMQYLNEDEEWKDYNSGFYPLDTYRIKPKSERELFIDAAASCLSASGSITPQQMTIVACQMFDSGDFKYIDNTQHFGENI